MKTLWSALLCLMLASLTTPLLAESKDEGYTEDQKKSDCEVAGGEYKDFGKGYWGCKFDDDKGDIFCEPNGNCELVDMDSGSGAQQTKRPPRHQPNTRGQQRVRMMEVKVRQAKQRATLIEMQKARRAKQRATLIENQKARQAAVQRAKQNTKSPAGARQDASTTDSTLHSPRDSASGLPIGKRIYKPMALDKQPGTSK
jgi:hypothetical protein